MAVFIIPGTASRLRKRPGWKRPSGEREEKQAAFLAEVRKRGGVAAFVTGVDDVVKELET